MSENHVASDKVAVPSFATSQLDKDILESERTLSIVVGPGPLEQTYTIKQSIFCRSSPAFLSAVRFKQRADPKWNGELRWKADSPFPWAALLFWIQQGRLPDAITQNICVAYLVRAWLLGKEFIMPYFQEVIWDELMGQLEKTRVGLSVAREVLEFPDFECPLQRLIAARFFRERQAVFFEKTGIWTDDIGRPDLVLRGTEGVCREVLTIAVRFPYLLSNGSTPPPKRRDELQ